MNLNQSDGHDGDETGACPVSVMLVDDDPVFLQAVVASLQAHHRDQLAVVGTARSSEECVVKAQALAPKVVLMDLHMPGRGGLWAIPLLQILFPETRVIALTFNDGADSRRAVLAAGGADLVSKMEWKTDLVPAIQRAVQQGDMDQSYASD
jgi:DNA-binding NarL/FixJ family response regulator